MQYIWNALSWFTCSNNVAVNPADAPTEPPKESSTLRGWKAWATSTKTKADIEKVVEEVKDVVAAVEKTVEEGKEAVKEVADIVEAVETGDIATIQKEVVEAVTSVAEVKTSVETVVEETKEAVTDLKETLAQIPEEKKELIEDDKKKEQEKVEDGEKDLGADFVPHN